MGTTKNQPLGSFLDQLYDRWEILRIIAECLKEEGVAAIPKDTSPLWVANPRSGTLPPEIVITNSTQSFTLQHNNGTLTLWVRGTDDNNKVYMKRQREPIIVAQLSDPNCFKKIAEKINE